MGPFTIRKKLLCIFFVAVFATAVIFAMDVYSTRHLAGIGARESQRIMLEGEKQKIQVATDSMASSLGKALAKIPGEADQAAFLREAIKDAFFEPDRSGYYYVYTGTVNVAHPVNPSLHGKDLSGLKGADGVYSVRELAKAAAGGGGFVTFQWAKPGKGDMPKLGYAAMIPGTRYWIGTGIYIDNIEGASAEIAGRMRAESQKILLVNAALFAVLFLGVLLPMNLVVSRGIVGVMRETTEAARSIASGNLDVRLSSGGAYEAGQLNHALAGMVASLKGTLAALSEKEAEALRKAQEATQAMREAEKMKSLSEDKTRTMLESAARLEDVAAVATSISGRLSGQVTQSSRGAQVQSQRVSETAAAMDQMNSIVLEVARSAGQAAQTAESARGRAQDGARAVSEVVRCIDGVRKDAMAVKEDMSLLGKQADGIGSIMNVISDIADQTNLLALNAAIEAARAGEAGRGFAVVADEVRKLAEKTMTATKEVGDAIRGIQHSTQQNIRNVDAAGKAIEEATGLAGTSGDTLEEIVRLVDQASGQVRAIAAASEEQSSASEEISRSIEQVAAISSETAEAMGEATRAVAELTNQAGILQKLIADMQGEGGNIPQKLAISA